MVPPDSDVGTVEAALCEGWEAGGRRCCFICTPGFPWMCMGEGVPYEQCRNVANSYCGSPAINVCWSR